MKSKQEVRTCDECGKNEIFIKEPAYCGATYFAGWIALEIHSVHEYGLTVGSDDMTGKKDFCCVDCAMRYLERYNEQKEQSEKEDQETFEKMRASMEALLRGEGCDDPSEPQQDLPEDFSDVQKKFVDLAQASSFSTLRTCDRGCA